VEDGLVGAVAEALANAGKHSTAATVTVYVEPSADGGIFCSVKDDGGGFDAATTAEGTGITSSIRGRLADVGGRAEIDGRAGSGTEVRLWVPAAERPVRESRP
jgi:signal transduction histidine kinase